MEKSPLKAVVSISWHMPIKNYFAIISQVSIGQKDRKSIIGICNKINVYYVELYILFLQFVIFVFVFSSFCSQCCQDLFIFTTLSWGTIAVTKSWAPFTDRYGFCSGSNGKWNVCSDIRINGNNIGGFNCCCESMAMFVEISILFCLFIIDSFQF